MTCTCETYGHCHVCGVPADVIADRLGIDSVSTVVDALAPYDQPIYCHWCWADITYRAQYPLDRDRRALIEWDDGTEQEVVFRDTNDETDDDHIFFYGWKPAVTEEFNYDGWRVVQLLPARKVCGPKCPCRPTKKEVTEHLVMSRKDYVAMAKVLSHESGYMSLAVYRRLVRRIGELYAKDNPRFDMRKWRKACGLNDS